MVGKRLPLSTVVRLHAQGARHPELKRELATRVPTEPGAYTDNQGAFWALRSDGRWVDAQGTIGPKSLNWALGMYGLKKVGTT